ncbi:MAG: protein translocase subunit SecF [Kiloniellales bacterium]|nr:protein translocase subunit SecF [Kiloniellales bacterium]
MALIKRLPTEPKFNFIGRYRLTLALSAVLVVISLGLFFTGGLNYGVDFRGGVMLEVRTKDKADLGALRSQLSGLGLGEVTLQSLDEETDVLINVQRQEGGDEAQNAAIAIIKDALADTVVEYRRIEFVGPKVGGELKEAALIATILALGAIALYIWFRFEWQFSLAALLALTHDVITTIGFFAITGLEFNLASVAAILTIAGYSINDTVVVFDRVRESLRKYKKVPVAEVLNMALNATLSRTLLTSITTLLALIALSVFGGHVVRGFSLALIWGVVVGTYSSIGVATPFLMLMNLRHSQVAKPEPEGTERAAAS